MVAPQLGKVGLQSQEMNESQSFSCESRGSCSQHIIWLVVFVMVTPGGKYICSARSCGKIYRLETRLLVGGPGAVVRSLLSFSQGCRRARKEGKGLWGCEEPPWPPGQTSAGVRPRKASSLRRFRRTLVALPVSSGSQQHPLPCDCLSSISGSIFPMFLRLCLFLQQKGSLDFRLCYIQDDFLSHLQSEAPL